MGVQITFTSLAGVLSTAGGFSFFRLQRRELLRTRRAHGAAFVGLQTGGPIGANPVSFWSMATNVSPSPRTACLRFRPLILCGSLREAHLHLFFDRGR